MAMVLSSSGCDRELLITLQQFFPVFKPCAQIDVQKGVDTATISRGQAS